MLRVVRVGVPNTLYRNEGNGLLLDLEVAGVQFEHVVVGDEDSALVAFAFVI